MWYHELLRQLKSSNRAMLSLPHGPAILPFGSLLQGIQRSPASSTCLSDEVRAWGADLVKKAVFKTTFWFHPGPLLQVSDCDFAI